MELEEAIKILKDCLSKIHRTFCSVGAVGVPSQEYFALETLLNGFFKEKARADKMEKDYSEALTKIDKLQADLYEANNIINDYFEKKAEEEN